MSVINAIVTERPARMFRHSMVLSAVRCTLSYLVFPFVLPLVGVSAQLPAGLGVALGGVAVAANGWSIRRFWQADHPYKVPISALNLLMIVLLLVLFAGDARDLFA